MWLNIPAFDLLACTLIFTTLLGTSKAADCLSNDPYAPKVAYTITVQKYGGYGNFTTIQAAINSIHSQNNRWVRILISPGFYREKVIVPADKPCILLQGKNSKSTMISWNDHTITDKSATFTSLANNFVAKNIAFKNAYRYQTPMNGNPIMQSVAVEVVGDKSSFHRCSFFGFQDTLWDVKGRHYFKNCYIEGAVDFIWGNGQSIYEGCKISVLPCLGGLVTGFITAQGRNLANENSGFVFKAGKVFGNGNAEAYLGRAYGAYSRVIWYGTEFSDVIVPQGWQAWNYVNHE
ncbi:probable pectinesterase 55 [Telopea speciosissima]|uniref:probable pectinesterase 55 n=1 Tax=Telopea speciosissima TaxID=54955 RepID=UPI001CC59950|nr:probable pectinesterase 55 [Telopea speciosissima]